MAERPGPPSWICVVVMSIFLGTDGLQVRYRKAYLLGVEGQSLKLTCNVEYNFTMCGQLDLSWYQLNEGKRSGLTDIQKYLNTVNETHLEPIRHRQTVTEFLQLAPEDQGLFQCVARCDSEEAMGHFINITVKAAPKDSQQSANNGGLNRGHDTSLTLWSLLPVWGSLKVVYTYI